MKLTQFQIMVTRDLRWLDHHVNALADAEKHRLMAEGLSDEDARQVVLMHYHEAVRQYEDEKLQEACATAVDTKQAAEKVPA